MRIKYDHNKTVLNSYRRNYFQFLFVYTIQSVILITSILRIKLYSEPQTPWYAPITLSDSIERIYDG